MNSFADFFWAMILVYFWFMVIWIFIRIFADIFRRQDLTGLWKVIWVLILFWIPFFGAMIYLIARPRTAGDTDAFGSAAATPVAAAAPSRSVAPSASSADEIAKLAALRDAGTITPAEFEAAKAKALG